MKLQSPEDLNRFVCELKADLTVAGYRSAAEKLAKVQGTAFTTGNEWLGELGAAVTEIRRECMVTPKLDAKLERIMKEVRRVWPAM